jgi:hypothetical protein
MWVAAVPEVGSGVSDFNEEGLALTITVGLLVGIPVGVMLGRSLGISVVGSMLGVLLGASLTLGASLGASLAAVGIIVGAALGLGDLEGPMLGAKDGAELVFVDGAMVGGEVTSHQAISASNATQLASSWKKKPSQLEATFPSP